MLLLEVNCAQDCCKNVGLLHLGVNLDDLCFNHSFCIRTKMRSEPVAFYCMMLAPRRVSSRFQFC